MTYVPPEIEPLEPVAPPDLLNRLAAVELRLRLAQPQERTAATTGPGPELGLLRSAIPPADSSAAVADPLDERALSRSDWAIEALQCLTDTLARTRLGAARVQAETAAQAGMLGAERDLERARRRLLEEAVARTYGQAQGLQEVGEQVRTSRAFRIGRRLARLTGRPGPQVTDRHLPLAAAVAPGDVACVLGSGVFDAEWYLRTYPDVSEAGADPLTHFLTRANAEHRCPGPLFDTGWYMRAYGDQLGDGENPLVHYLTQGWRHGNRPWESFDPADYVRQHPEVEDMDVCPLLHRALISTPG